MPRRRFRVRRWLTREVANAPVWLFLALGILLVTIGVEWVVRA